MRTTHTAFRLPVDLLAELDAWRARQTVTPTRTASVTAAIRRLIRRPSGTVLLTMAHGHLGLMLQTSPRSVAVRDAYHTLGELLAEKTT